MLSLDDVRAARRRLDGVAHRTPVLHSRTLDGIAGARVHLKAECFQRGGAFKFRGAYSLISSLGEVERAAGVVAFSSGNHAQAVALASSLLGVPATIVMPEDAPAAKLAATRGYGAEVVLYDRYTGDREAIARELVADRGATLVPPFDHPLVIAGQGTAALELLEDAGPLDTLLAPVGGGGLVAGCATVAAALDPKIRVIGVEPEAGDDTRRSLAAGRRIEIPIPRTIADGQQISRPGALTFPIVQRLVSEVVLVSDDELVDAMRFAFDRLKIVLEPSGACGLAAVMTRRVDAGARCGVILSGGNVGLERFVELYRS
jgi:threo-3-hydroxy-L-aspartate ammonia-lyase